MTAELLAPAGSMEGLRASVQNGADAVYLGGKLFGARSTADNFDDLSAAVEYCHLRGVRVHLTVNTLVKDAEFGQLDELIGRAAEAGVDACIVQDIAVAGRIAALAPGMPLHASTQMAIIGRYGARWAKSQGFSRVIAARECAVEAVADMAAHIDTEVFVQGALCVCYSGQCLMSSMIGGRSGNRGRCAQPCRLPYELSGKEGYWLSTRDLCLLDRLAQWLRAGVTSFKIEGRLRRPEYAAVATAAYRRALDAALEGRQYDGSRDRDALFAMFNRGEFTEGYAFGFRNGDITNPRRPNNAGVRIGRARGGLLFPDVDIHKGDALEVAAQGMTAQADVEAGRATPARLPDGEVYRLVDARLMEAARGSYAHERRARPIEAALTLRPGERAKLRLGDVQVQGEVVQQALRRPLSREEALRAVDKFDGLPFALRSFSFEGEGAFLPVSSLNALRRNALCRLKADLLERSRLYDVPTAAARGPASAQPKPQAGPPLLILQSSEVAELLRAQGAADLLYYEPLDWRPPALGNALAQLPPQAHILLPFWLEGDMLKEAMEAIGARPVVAGSPGHLPLLTQPVSDWTLHAFSGRGVREWLAQGASRATLSPELTLREMQQAALTGPCEMVVHGQLPLMTLRHCPAAADPRSGSAGACAACSLPDSLIDRKGVAFPLRRIAASDGCRVQLLNGHLLTGLRDVPALLRAGCTAWRIIGRLEDLHAFRRVLDGGEPALAYEIPLTRGHWFRGVE